MPAIQQQYLRLCLAQGVSLIVGFTLFFLLQRGAVNAVQEAAANTSLQESVGRLQSTSTKGAIVTGLATWSLLAGVTGILLIRDQRAQLESILQQHDDDDEEVADRAALKVIRNETLELSPPETFSIPLDVTPCLPRLRLAVSDEDSSGDYASSPASASVTLTLHR